MVPLSVLDLAPITQGSTPAEALHRSVDLARHVESWGYRRYWLAEHHGMPGIASAATAVVIGHIAGATKSIRVGAGGIMLPNHSPLVIAEQFGTLESLYPGRVDLGLGRAPGTDPATARALRRGGQTGAETFPQDVVELLAYFGAGADQLPVRAVPGAGLRVPVWLLGSSLFSAQLAAALGLPFAFAAHFAPDLLFEALELYRANFKASEAHSRPYAAAAIAVYAADTDAEAARLFTSLQQSFVQLHRGAPGPLPPPVLSMDALWTQQEAAGIRRAFREAVVGSAATVREGIQSFVTRTRVDELIVTAAMFDHAARLRSFQMVAEIAC